MTLRLALAVAIAACGAAGCADPYADDDSPREGTVAGEVSARPVPRPTERLGALPNSPEAAIRRAARLTTTWTSSNAARRYAAFATFAVGAARRQAQEAAARVPTDPQLDRASSDGHVAAVVTTAGTRQGREMLVVTRETVRTNGLVERSWRVTLASVEHRDGGWVVVRWEPQP